MTLIIGFLSLIISGSVLKKIDKNEHETKVLEMKSNMDQLTPLEKLNQTTREVGDTVSRGNERMEKSLIIGGIGMVIGFISGLALTRKRNKKIVAE